MEFLPWLKKRLLISDSIDDSTEDSDGTNDDIDYTQVDPSYLQPLCSDDSEKIDQLYTGVKQMLEAFEDD
jgi:hypothetical protein